MGRGGQALELVWLPAGGGNTTSISPYRNAGRPHFAADPNRIYAWQGSRHRVRAKYEGRRCSVPSVSFAVKARVPLLVSRFCFFSVSACVLWCIAPMRIGIDLGGTKIEGAVLDDHRNTLVRRRIATPRGDYEATIAALKELVGDLEQAAGTRCTVGVGMPGTISRATGVVKNANSVWLNGRTFDKDLAAALGREIRCSNDANCFALSEAIDGAGRGARVVFGVIIGTGTGGGVVVDHHVLEGHNGVAGEWGHNPLPWPDRSELPGPPCYCGRTGCIEMYLSGPGLALDFELATGDRVMSEVVVARAASGDGAACASIGRYEHRMARALASVINLLDPDVIVLGGGLSNIDRLYQRVPAQWSRWVFSDRVDTPLVKNAHGDSGGVRGAAWLWSRDRDPGLWLNPPG
jgi:fructokinase